MVDLRINETLRTGAVRKLHLPAPIISLPRFIGGIETEGRKCLFIFRIHYKIRCYHIVSVLSKKIPIPKYPQIFDTYSVSASLSRHLVLFKTDRGRLCPDFALAAQYQEYDRK